MLVVELMLIALVIVHKFTHILLGRHFGCRPLDPTLGLDIWTDATFLQLFLFFIGLWNVQYGVQSLPNFKAKL